MGRDLSSILMVDNRLENFKYQPENAIQISSWYSDDTDNTLMQLMPILVEIAKSQPVDIREALKKKKQEMADEF